MYSLSQMGSISYDDLQTILSSRNFTTHTTIPGIWTHKFKDLSFILTINDFVLKYTKQHEATYFTKLLSTKYHITIDWSGSNYCGLNLTLSYDHPRHVDINMCTYVTNILTRYNHSPPNKMINTQFPFICTYNSQYSQILTTPDNTQLLSSELQTKFQQIIGSILFYGQEMDNTTLIT